MRRLELAEIKEAVHGRLVAGRADRFVEGISTDTRSMKRGQFFVALRGERFDGHDFLAKAVAAGAAGVMVDERGMPEELPETVGVVLVRDTVEALGDLARYYRKLFGVTVVAVTGSNGKTTTKDMIAHVLEPLGGVVASPGSFNNFIGLPLTLFGLEDNSEVAVVEMGTSAPGEIARLAAIADPDVGVITNIAGVHLEGLKSIEGVASAKGELLDALGADALAVLNADDEWVMKIRPRSAAKAVTFGLSPDADIRAQDVKADETGITFVGPERTPVEVPVLGRHNVYNALAAIAVARRAGMSMKQVAERLRGFRPPHMRMEVLDIDGITVLNDSYNANPVSMRSALDAFSLLQITGRKHAVLADMLELGPSAQQLHRQLGRELAGRRFEDLWLFGPLMAEAAQAAQSSVGPGTSVHHCDTFEEFAEMFLKRVSAGDGVLIKGSRAMGTERVVELLRSRDRKD